MATGKRFERREFLRASAALAAWGLLPVGGTGCAPDEGGEDNPLAERADALEAAGLYWDEEPAYLGEAAPEPHVPRVSFVGPRTVLVRVGANVEQGEYHPMTDEHYTTMIYLRDQDGRFVSGLMLDRTASPNIQPDLRFELPQSVVQFQAFAHCNLHGVWRSAFVDV